jgi:shikimate dehydrogenase
MKISGTTNVVAILGYPVEHSLSPSMHNAAFERMGLDYCYVAFPVHPHALKEAVLGVRALGFAGLNVTVPHKEAIMPVLDRVESEASFMGAVNTVVNRDGKLIGHNTDGRGFMRSLEEEGVEVEGKRVLLVGAGGAARAVSWYVSEKASELSIFNRTPERAERLVSDLSINRKNVSRVETLDAVEVGEVDIIINATSLGLREEDPLPFDVAGLHEGQTVVDLIYLETKTLREASSRGCRVLGGLGMLLWQGMLAFELWTGHLPPGDIMRDALVKGMKKRLDN